jgi:hypothetical protein
MKVKDLKTGAEYLVNRSQNWTDSTYSSDTLRVRYQGSIVAHWKRDKVNGGWIPQKYASTSSVFGYTTHGVLVEILDHVTGEVKEQGVVSLASIRGAWEPTWKMVQENRARRDAERKAAEDARNAGRNRVGVVLAKAAQFLGLKPYSNLVSDAYKTNHVMIDVNLLDAMLTELEKHDWKYEQ